MKRIILFLILFFVFLPRWYAVNTQVENIYEEFVKKIDSSYSLTQQEEIFKKIDAAAQNYYWDKRYTEKREVFWDLLSLNNEKLYTLWEEKILAQTQQKIKELSLRKNLSNSLSDISHPSYIRNLLGQNSISFLSINEQREFIENAEIKKIEYSLYYPIQSSNASAFKNKSGIIVYEDDEYRFIEDYSFNTKIPYSQLESDWFVLLNKDKKFSQKNSIFYAYNFTKFRYFADEYGIYESQLEKEYFSSEKTLVYVDENWKYNFVTSYNESKIGNNDIIFWASEKHIFLNNLADDMLYESINIEETLESIQTISQSMLQTSQSREEYVQKVYDYILQNISYTENINLENTEIFSWIETFERNDGVCTGYTKLMSYLLHFWNISDVEVIRWYVIDAQDFPQIGHAWVRIWEIYFDPTFDDPIGTTQTRVFDDYIYYWLPKDIFYANRYTYDDLPFGLKTANSSEISAHIYDRLKRLILKYQDNISDYKVFWPVVFRETYNISQDVQITPQVLANAIGSYEVKNNSFRFIEDGKTKQISFFRYFKLDSENTEQILKQLAYEVDELYLFDWELTNGMREWRLAYEIEVK